MPDRTPKEIRLQYQQILFELQNRLQQATPKSESELEQSMRIVYVTEDDLRSLSKVYKVMLDGCPEDRPHKCWDGSCVADPADCPPEPPGGIPII